MNRRKNIMEYLKKNPLLRPFPAIVAIVVIIWVVYFLILFCPPIYDLLEHKSDNPFGFFTNMWIHDLDDQGYHILNNTTGIIVFGYIVSIQTSRKNMVIVFLLSGILTSIFLGIFVSFMNATLTERYVTWATAQGVIIIGDFHLFSTGGGGASNAIMGLSGFSFVLAGYYFILFIVRNARDLYHRNLDLLKQTFKENWIFLLINSVAIVFTSFIFYERLVADFLMFTYTLTYLYAFVEGVGIPFPLSRGHPLLAHIFGALFGFLLGLVYLIDRNSNQVQEEIK
ncbi:hypothetical protein CEE45_01535 [Candidatus Heimdallarchaeota archaeon B3_Heim]|nr:MAG: hypothetical protein CEE45_01535 [Candidatus Heimdallarchaeota archaeon B3_Heim]